MVIHYLQLTYRREIIQDDYSPQDASPYMYSNRVGSYHNDDFIDFYQITLF